MTNVWATNMRKVETRGGGGTLAKATVSSLLATVVDAAAYQWVLFVAIGHYGIAAALAAIAGALTNFFVNRYWTFDARSQKLQWQGLRYAVVSLLTFCCLRAMLWLLIEVAGVGMRIAWLPAKILAFVLVSFPLQQVWVFRAKTS
jgi:putative flippase GtrA